MVTQKTFRPCVIHVGDNRKLMEIAIGIAKQYSRREFMAHQRLADETCVVIYEDGDFFTNPEPEVALKYPRFDLTQQPLGALLDYLDKPEEVKVSFGCAGMATIEKDGAAQLRACAGTLLTTLEAVEIDALYAASQAARKPTLPDSSS